MEDKELKIFELRWTMQDEREWVCAYSNVHALMLYCNETSTSLQDLHELDEINEVPKSLWDERFIINTEYDANDPEDWEKKSFTEYMKEQMQPDLIATSMY
jgi:hypothetical protein